MELDLGIFYLILFAADAWVLTVASVGDVFSRTVNSFLFVPVIIAGIVFGTLSGVSPLMLISVALMFATCFFVKHTLIYLIAQTAIFSVSMALSILLGVSGFVILIAFIYALMGYRQFIGIGDVKAFLALAATFSSPLLVIVGGATGHILGMIPVPFFVMLNSTIVSIFYVPYLLIINHRKGSLRKSWSFYAVPYDEAEFRKNESKYRIREVRGERIMVYRMPFLVPIASGFLVAMLTGL